ncbi:MAG: sigma-70 family RNA polymerase sigma factor [Sedimentisphaerales bacterium]|nr:sigma-70 family RNA polymerase sigma factor [Sedimentisphaerales bacterium]
MMDEQSKNSDGFLNHLMHKQMRIYAFILSMVRNYQDADDILQDTVNTMWQKYAESQPIHDFVAWGIQIAYYKIMDFRKKQKGNIHIQYTDQLFEKMLPVTRETDRYSDKRLDKLKKCLKKLGPRQSKFVELRYYQDLKPRQIASLLGLSILNVYKIMSRIHSQLLDCVKST